MTVDTLDLEIVDDDAEETGLLTPQEALFCEALGNPESATFGNGTKSARVAKYVQPRNAAWKLRRRPRIKARLAEMHALALVDIGKVMSGIEHCRLAAEKKGDLAVVAKCLELQGKRLGAWVDVQAVDDVQKRKYDARLAVQANRLAKLLLEEEGQRILGLPVPGDCVGGQSPTRKQLNPGAQKENDDEKL